MNDRGTARGGGSEPWSDPGVDPRRIVTPDAFQVAPELLGRPLAGPWRRLGAMLVDLFLLALLTNAGGVFFALAAAIALLRATTTREASLLKRGVIVSLRVVGALVLFVAVIELWDGAAELLRDDGPAERVGREIEAGELNLGALDGIGITRDFIRLSRARSPEQARPAAERIVDRVMATGEVDRAELRQALDALTAEGDLPDAAAAALRDALAARLAEPGPAPDAVESADATPTDSLLRRYAAAIEVSDSAALAALEPVLVERIAGDSLAALAQRYQRTRDRLRRTERALDAAEEELEQESNLGRVLLVAADEAGLGLGWSWLYFTVFLVLWNGQTPGKRLLGIRVIRLDGKPLGWWASLERFGGYFAALITGLLGFAQILWDRNRQGVHDKISETVVVRVREKKAELRGRA